MTEKNQHQGENSLSEAWKSRKLHLLMQAKDLGEQFSADVIGVCGHLTGAGAREYPVFRDQNGTTFIVFGKSDEMVIVDDIVEYQKSHSQEQRKPCVPKPAHERGGYV